MSHDAPCRTNTKNMPIFVPCQANVKSFVNIVKHYTKAVVFKASMFLFVALFLAQADARRHRRSSRARHRRHSTNAISEMDIKVPFSQSWYYGRQKSPKADELTSGINKVLQSLKSRRVRDAMLTDLLFTEATKAGAIVDKMAASYLGNRRKYRDDEVYLQEQMDDSLLYALSVLAQREQQQVDYAKRQRERELEIQRQEEQAERDEKRKREQTRMEMEYRQKQMDYEMQRQMALDQQAGKTTKYQQAKSTGLLSKLFG